MRPKFRDYVSAELKYVDFPTSQYYHSEHPKKQIVLHHTASGRGVTGDIAHWLNTSSRIATCCIIDYKGVIHQAFSSSKWGHHLGVKRAVFEERKLKSMNMQLNQESIGIEIDAWGQLTEKDGKFYNYVNQEVPEDRVAKLEVPFRGFKYYEKYTDAQLKTVEQLLQYWGVRYDIPLDYNPDIWDVTNRALEGERGVFAHVSYRSDKNDVFPQSELLEMLQGLKS